MTGLYDGRFFVNATNVVLVVSNYRLGALGWLYAPSADINGNMGFLDQLMLLQWVKTNIAAFGGDPDHVRTH